MTTLLDWLAARRRLALLIAAVIGVVLLVAAATAVHHVTATTPNHAAAPARQTSGSTAAPGPAPSPATTASSPDSLTPADQSALDGTLAWLRAMPLVPSDASPAHPHISRQARQQPDLYAAALVRGLLTQDYRTPRGSLLAWVQAESAPSAEPTVVGLIPPELRPRLAVASVQEGFDGPGPVPTQGVWDALAAQHAYTTVVIQRVTEPVNWSAAVAAGQVIDPGVTAREVDAEVTLHSTAGGHAHASVTSVALTVNLEGPPVRDHYGLVSLVTYLTRQGQS